MEDKITLDRETFKALAIDSRVCILKKLDERFQLTLSDLAEEMGMAPSTIKEHLDKLVSAGLISQADKGTKWKYYRLTSKGKKILNPYEKRVWIILSASLLVLFGAVYSLVSKLQALMGPVPLVARGPPAADAAGGLSMEEEGLVLNKAFDAMQATSTTAAEEVSWLASNMPAIPYAELLLVVLLVLVVGICVGYLIRRKRIL